MIYFDIIGKNKQIKFHAEKSEILECYRGELSEGDEIKIRLDGVNTFAVRLDPSLQESLIYAPNKSFSFKIPSPRELRAGYAPNAFCGEEHIISVREVSEEEFYATRNIALNAHDLRRKTGGYPHASANFVTREEPCFYERNAIDGEKNNQGHGEYPYHSWAGGARNDLEFTLDFGREVEIDEIAFYLRADFVKDEKGEPHDSYWKSLDVQFDDGEIKKCFFELDREVFPNVENAKGRKIVFEKKKTRKIKLYNFEQVTEILGFAALTQIEVYGRYSKENLDKMEVRQASNAKDVKHYTTERLREEFHISNLFTKDNVRMVYSHIDRIITAGLMPVRQTLKLEAGKELAADYFLQRREMGCINIGGGCL